MIRTKNTFSYGATDSAKSQTLHENGFIKAIVYVLPNFTTAVSGVLTIKDQDGATLYTSAAINENATTVVASLNIPVDYQFTTTFTLNDVAGGSGGNAVVTYYINTQE